MLHARDLLDHAARLVTAHGTTEADFRRAVSAAYYAAFHLIGTAVSEQACPSSPTGLRGRFQRGLEHGVMKKAMEPFRSKQNFPVHSANLGVLCCYSPDLAEVAELFDELQDARQVADYDIEDSRRTISLSWASNCVNKAERLFDAWNRAKASDEAKFFLASLIFGSKWSR